MKEPTVFPFEHQAAGLVFRIYSAPLVKTNKDGTETTHRSFLVKHYEGANHIQKRQKSWEDVEAYIEEVAAAHRAKDPERLELTGLDRRIYLAAVEALKSTNKAVDQAVRDCVAATNLVAPYGMEIVPAAQLLADSLKRLEKVPMSTAIDFYLQHGKTMTAIKTVPEVIEELTENVKKDGCGDYHLRDLETRLGRFAISFPGNIHEITEREITAWLQNLKKVVWKNGKQVENDLDTLVSKRTRNNYRDAINELFEFARKCGYVPKGLPTAAAETARVKVVSGKNHIITPREAKAVLENLSPHFIPYTVLKIFSGLRTEEAFRLCWEDLRFGSKAVVIEAKLTKLKQRRVPPILPNLAKWLRPFRGLSGRINPGYSSPQAVHKAVAKEARKKAGVILRHNVFRNCYVSYRVAQPQLPAIVAEEAGTSVRMVKSNYLELATKPEAKQWFSINPSKSKIAEMKAFVKKRKRRQAK